MDKPLRLGVFLHGLMHSDGMKIVSYSTSMLFLNGLEEYGFKPASLCASLENHPEPIRQGISLGIKERGIDFYPLPAWHDVTEQIRCLPYQWTQVIYTIRNFVDSCDILWIRAPTILLSSILREARRQRKPAVVHMAGNLGSQWKSTKHSGIKRIMVRLGGQVFNQHSRKVLRHKTLLATGPELVRIFAGPERKVIHFVDSLVSITRIRRHQESTLKRLLFVGRIDHGKGLFAALKVLERLNDLNIPVKLTIVGDGPILKNLKDEADRRGVSDLIKWRGFIPYGKDLDREYTDSDILLLPSEASEGFPRVILEAWANGVVVIASRVGGVSELIHHAENGLLINPGDHESLVTALQRLWNEKGLYSKLMSGGYSALVPYTYEEQLSVATNELRKAYQKG